MNHRTRLLIIEIEKYLNEKLVDYYVDRLLTNTYVKETDQWHPSKLVILFQMSSTDNFFNKIVRPTILRLTAKHKHMVLVEPYHNGDTGMRFLDMCGGTGSEYEGE